MRLISRAHPLLGAFMESLPPGSVLYDIGANIGVVSVLAAKRGCVVEALEPAPTCHAALTRNAALNGVEVRAHLVAASDRDGSVPFFVESDDPATGTGHVGRSSHGHPDGALWKPSPEVIEARTRSIDSLVSDGMPDPDAIKVDVEGHEASVLDGAAEALKRCGVVLLEVHPDRLPRDETERSVLARLESAGLRLAETGKSGRQGHFLFRRPITRPS